jgi:hypothetical protein
MMEGETNTVVAAAFGGVPDLFSKSDLRCCCCSPAAEESRESTVGQKR